MDRFEGFRAARAQLIAAAQRIEATRRYWREVPAAPVSHVAAVWPDVERAAERLIASERLSDTSGARAVVRWLALALAVASRGGWPPPERFPGALARDLSAEDLDALDCARPRLAPALLDALGRAADERLSPDHPSSVTCAAWLTAQLDAALGTPVQFAHAA